MEIYIQQRDVFLGDSAVYFYFDNVYNFVARIPFFERIQLDKSAREIWQ